MKKEQQFATIIIDPKGKIEKIPLNTNNKQEYEKHKINQSNKKNKEIQYYYDIYAQSKDPIVKKRNDENPSLYGSILASNLAKDGYIVLFLGSLSPDNKEYFHHYLYLPFKDITEPQQKNLKRLLDIYSFEGKTNLKKVNKEQKLIVFKGGCPTVVINLKNSYINVEQLSTIIFDNKANLEVKINSEGSIEEKRFYVEKEEEKKAIIHSQMGSIVLQCGRDLKKDEAYIRLYIPLNIVSKEKEETEMEKKRQNDLDFDLELIVSRVKELVKLRNMLDLPVKLTLFIGGDEVEHNISMEFNNIKNIKEFVKDKTMSKIKSTNYIAVDETGRLICNDKGEDESKKSPVLIYRGNPNRIYLNQTIESERTKRAFLNLLKLGDFWINNENSEGISSIYIDKKEQGQINYKNSKNYNFLNDSLKFYKKYYKKEEDIQRTN